MDAKSRIYVAGHRGLAGSAVVRELVRVLSINADDLLLRTHDELDLTDQGAVDQFFSSEKPEYVFIAAARVGGIHANNTYPAEFIRDNLAIQTNLIHAAHKNEVKRLIFLGSSCIYPKNCPQPMAEEYLLTGSLESTNRPYAIAKIAGVEMCWSYNRQYGTQYLSAMPTNLYGVGDHYSLMNSHVIPAMIRKIHLAKLSMESRIGDIVKDEFCFGEISPDIKGMLGLDPNTPITLHSKLEPATSVTLWGTGTPRREFIYSDDMAAAVVYLMGLPDAAFEGICTINPSEPPLVNIGFGQDITIKELAETVKDVVGFKGEILFDATKPDGTPRKLLDVSRLSTSGWQAQINLRDGISLAYRDFLARGEVAN